MTRLRASFGGAGLTLLTTLSVGLASSASSAPGTEALRLRAVSVDLNNRAKVNSIDIVIERWSAPEEASELRAVFVEKGADELLSSLQKVRPRCGFVRTSTSLGWDIYYAKETALPDGGRRIILASDRPVSVWEARHSGRSMDYQFSLAEIRLGADGKGEGKAIPAAKLTLDESTNTLEIENWDREPVRLTEVTVVQ